MNDQSTEHDAPNRLEDLPAPSIPAALDGGLGYDDVERDPQGSVIVTVGPYFDIQEGDLIEVFWSGTRVAFQDAKREDANGVSIPVPKSEIKQQGEGTFSVMYKITFFVGGGHIDSLETDVVVKFSVPGGPDPKPDTPYLNENLDKPFVDPDPVPDDAQSATVNVEPWGNMAAGDVLTVRWAQESVQCAPLPAGQVNLRQSVPIDRALLESVGGGRIPVTYSIRDTVNNFSLWAPYTYPDVEIEDPDAPEAPAVVVGGDQVDEIDLTALGTNDVTVRVPRYDGITPGQEVIVEWFGQMADGSDIPHTSDPETVPNPLPFYLDFPIPNAKVTPLGQGSVRVYYVVDGTRLSKKALLQVVGDPLVLLPPEIPDAPNDELDPATVPAGARFIVPILAGIQPGVRVEIHWAGKDADGNAELPYSDGKPWTDPSQPLAFTVPPAYITPIAGGSATASYTIGNGPDPLPSPARELRIKVQAPQPLPIPTVDGVLNGVISADLPSTIVHIPHYADMALGDVITVNWSAPTPTGGTVEVTTIGEQQFPVAGAYIAINTGHTVTVTYSVPGKGVSTPLQFFVESADIQPEQPVIPKAPMGRLNVHNDFYRDEFLQVQVQDFPGMAKGQSIEVEWAGPYFTWKSTAQVVDTPKTLVFDVPRLEVIDAIGRSVEVRYLVNGTPSPTLVLDIDRQGMEMPPPRFNPQPGRDSDAVSILSPDQQTGHTGRVRWQGVRKYDTDERHLTRGEVEYFQIPRAYVEENRGKEVLVNYTIYRGDDEQLRFSRVLRLQL